MKTNYLNCNGNCNGNCEGDVSPVLVFWPNYLYCFGTFHYCKRAIKLETKKGNIVEAGPPPLEPIPERTNSIKFTAMLS
jgi:hypothetical protein